MRKLKFTSRFAVAVFLFFVFLCSPPISWAGEDELKEESANEKQRHGKEIFVDKVVEPFKLFWCGNNALLFEYEKGVFIYDVESRKKTHLGDRHMSTVACTPDGQWFVYRGPDDPELDTNSKEFGIINLWRYELKTGKKQMFLVADNAYASSVGEGLFSPLGNTIHLTSKPVTAIEMPEPKWDVVWLERNNVGQGWLNDPVALVGAGKYNAKSGTVEIDVVSPYKKKIKLGSGFHNARFLMTDAQGNIYLETSDDNFGNGRRIIRCSVDFDNKEISCGTLFFGDLISEGFSSYSGFDIPGDVNFAVIAQGGNSCVRLRRIGESGGRCVTSTDHKIGSYVRISPDGKWLAYETFDGLYITEFTIN